MPAASHTIDACEVLLTALCNIVSVSIISPVCDIVQLIIYPTPSREKNLKVEYLCM